MSRLKQSECGMTLVEMLVAVVILSLITGGIASALFTALNVIHPTDHRVKETDDAQIIATFLTRDAQAAGGTDPNTGSQDTDPTHNLGVSTTDAAGCTNASGTLLLRFKWFDRTPTLTSGQQNVVAHVASYYFNAASNQLVRTTCDSATSAPPSSLPTPPGPPTSLTLATTIASVAATCSPSTCPSLPDTVSLMVTATNQTAGTQDPATAPYTYTLTASVRPEGQTPPCDATVLNCTTPTGTINPVITLGGTCNAENVSGLDVGGSAQVDVNGGITLSGGVAGCAASHFHLGNNGSFQSGQIETLAQIVDPFAGLTPPPDTCATSTSNPTTSTSGGVIHYHPGTYVTNPSINGNVTAVFDPGTYVFCAGLTINGNNTNVSGTDVLLYIKGGTLNLNGGTVNLTAQSSGTYDGLLIWQARSDTTGPMVISGNTALTLNGIIYAPSIEVQLRGGANTFFVKAIIAGSVSFSGTSGITIGTPPPQLFISTPTSLPSWTVGVPYPTIALTATGGSGGNTWTVTGLPDGLTFNPGANTISGTPTVPGLFSPQIKLVDSDGDIALAVYSVTINAAPSISGPATLPSADVGRDYPPPSMTAVMTATGGTAPYTWSESGLPPGLTINAGSGAISGNPTTTGTYSPTITLTDGAGATTSRTYSNGITINPLPVITAPTGPSLPSWTTGQSGYSQQITVTGGTANFTWKLSGGPSGLSINNSGLITGTPTGPQTYSLVVTATDADGAAASQAYSLTINPGLFVNANVPDGEINVPYSASVAGSSGTPPYSYSWSPVPPGLTLDPNSGAISGTPTAANSYAPIVTVTDSVGATATKNLSFVINPAPTITGPATLPSWTKNQDYGQQAMTGSGGLTPYQWTATGLPPGLALNSSSGKITGTPTTVGTYTVNITLTDNANVTAPLQTFTVTINDVPQISAGSFSDGEQGVNYSNTVSATGGTQFSGGIYHWTISSGQPPGLTINVNTGVISGVPTSSGSFLVTVVATDAAGATASVTRTLNISPPATNQLSLSDQSGGGSLLVGTTVYYQGSTAGSFTITNAVSTGGTPVSSTFPALSAPNGGWTHVGSTVNTPAAGPYVSTTFSWGNGTSSSPTEAITGTDSLGGTVTTTLTFVNDSAAPAPTLTQVGNGGFTNSTTPAIGGTAGTQAQDATHSADSTLVTVRIYSGPNTSGTLLQTLTATVSGGTWTVIEAPLTANAQYTAQVTQTDAVGNTGTATRTFVIDTVAPTVTAAMSNGGGGSKVTVSGTAGSQAADATDSADNATVAVNICTQANYTSHGNTCSAGWAIDTSGPGVVGGSYTQTTGNIGNGTYYATVTQSDAGGNTGSVTTGPFVR